MMHRREFLKFLGLGSMGLLCPPSALAAMAAKAQLNLPPKLIFDSRYPLASEYAKQLHQEGIATIDTQGDLVGLWYRDTEALRLRSGQMMLGYTTWSDYQALRVLIDDARLGRDAHLARQGNPGRPTLLQQKPGQAWPQALARHFPSAIDKKNRVHLVTWLAFV